MLGVFEMELLKGNNHEIEVTSALNTSDFVYRFELVKSTCKTTEEEIKSG